MSHSAIGKLLPNLKITVDEESRIQYETKSDEVLVYDEGDHEVEVIRSWMTSLQNPKVYKNKSGAFTTGLDLFSEKNVEKLDKRAERFGIEKECSSIAENIFSLYESMDIDVENRNSAKMKNLRLNALHMRGVNELNTKDIFQYFQDFGPDSVEWINDFSCNVVWLDETTCARALLGTSKAIHTSLTKKESTQPDCDSMAEKQNQSIVEESKKEEGELMDTEEEPPVDIDIPIPPGVWRVGNPHPKAKAILFRFAIKDDKKLPGAEKRSTFYRKYGNPNFGGLPGLISSSRKRKMLAATNKNIIESSKSIINEVFKNEEDVYTQKTKIPRMRMYADDEELKQIKSRLSDPTDKPSRASVHSRLGTKYTQDDLCYLGVDPSLRKKPKHQVDLRKKITKLKAESDTNKHRSPLCKDDL